MPRSDAKSVCEIPDNAKRDMLMYRETKTFFRRVFTRPKTFGKWLIKKKKKEGKIAQEIAKTHFNLGCFHEYLVSLSIWDSVPFQLYANLRCGPKRIQTCVKCKPKWRKKYIILWPSQNALKSLQEINHRLWVWGRMQECDSMGNRTRRKCLSDDVCLYKVLYHQKTSFISERFHACPFGPENSAFTFDNFWHN